jgi:hypothetical protein
LRKIGIPTTSAWEVGERKLPSTARSTTTDAESKSRESCTIISSGIYHWYQTCGKTGRGGKSSDTPRLDK